MAMSDGEKVAITIGALALLYAWLSRKRDEEPAAGAPSATPTGPAPEQGGQFGGAGASGGW